MDNGHFAAHDADAGEQPWHARMEAGVNAPPISYAIDGVQYIAAAAGGKRSSGFREGDTVQIFALSGKAGP